MLIGDTLIQAAAVAGFILVCLPAILGHGGFTPGPLLGPLVWTAAKAWFLVVAAIR